MSCSNASLALEAWTLVMEPGCPLGYLWHPNGSSVNQRQIAPPRNSIARVTPRPSSAARNQDDLGAAADQSSDVAGFEALIAADSISD